MENRDKKTRKLIEEVKKDLESSTCCTLGEREDYGEDWLNVYRLEEKKFSELYVPIEIYFNLREKTISLRFELSLGLLDLGKNNNIKKIANWLREYADYIEAKEKEILELGYYTEQTVIDGIHPIYFFYRKDFPLDQVGELVKEAKNLIENVWIIGVL